MAAPGSPRSGKDRVARVMKINGIAARTKRKFNITTVSRHDQPAAKDLVNRVFEADPATSGDVVLRYYLPLDKRGLVVSVGDSGCLLSPDCPKDPCDRLVDKPMPDQGPGYRCFPASCERQNSKSGDDLAFRLEQSLCRR